MSNRFRDKVVLVTGGSNGIGAGCARVFHDEGAKAVIVLDKDKKVDSRLAKLTRVKLRQCNLSDPNQFRPALIEEVSKIRQLDCIINNVGWHPPATPLDRIDFKDFEKLLRLNLTTTFLGCQWAAPFLKRTSGTIVNITSLVGLMGEMESSSYAATKAGQIGLTKALAIELGPNVRVNAVAPSSVDTPLMQQWLRSMPDPAAARRAEENLHVLKRLATPEEIARVCLFLATEDSSFITGQVIQVDGGASLLHPR